MQSPISSAFHAWLQKHGVIAHGIEAAFVDEGWRGVAATRELPTGMSSVCKILTHFYKHRMHQSTL